MPLLTSTDYPSIRAAIDISLTATDLPDATIALDIFIGAAMREVLSRDPEAESRTGDDLARVKAAAVYLTAARLIVTLPQILRETDLDTTYQRQAVDVAARAAELRALAEAELNEVLEPDDATADRPTMFDTAHGYRGRW